MNVLRIIAMAALISAGTLSSVTWALQPSHEADRLIMATEAAMAANNYREAEDNLNRIMQLGVTPPAEYDFFYGKLLHQRNRDTEARQRLESYVNTTGRDGIHYRAALALITEIESESRGNRVRSVPSGDGKSEIQWSQTSAEYISRLKELYNVSEDAAALTLHINSLLKFYAYGDERIIAGSARLGTPSRHRIETSPRGELISMNQFGADEQTPFREDRFTVYGIDPYINYECNPRAANCWLIHPVSGERWIQLLENRDAVAEVAKAMSELIKTLQKSG